MPYKHVLIIKGKIAKVFGAVTRRDYVVTKRVMAQMKEEIEAFPTSLLRARYDLCV